MDQISLLAERIREALSDREANPELSEALARWEHYSPVVWADGQWLVSGIVSQLQGNWEILRAIEPSLSPGLPSHCLDPKVIANFLGIPVEELDWSGRQEGDNTKIAARIEGKLDQQSQSLSEIKANLATLVQQHTVKESYTTEDICKIFDKAPFTVREWCRLRRINARKVPSSRGSEFEWRISHQELIRIQNEGLLPIASKY